MKGRWIDGAALFLAATCLVAVCLWFSPQRPPAERATPVSTETIEGIVVSESGTLIDINTADADLFSSLPGIGETLASRIVAYRDEHGSFASIDGLMQVRGIGEKTMEALRKFIVVQ